MKIISILSLALFASVSSFAGGGTPAVTQADVDAAKTACKVADANKEVYEKAVADAGTDLTKLLAAHKACGVEAKKEEAKK